jgi:hypothetical protein
VICSGFVKGDIEKGVANHGIRFLEIDQVQVKGKTEGKRIYWAILEENITTALEKELETFSKGLQHYYEGDWPEAYKQFNRCSLPLASVFKERTKGVKSHKGWTGIWEMKTK